MTALPEVTVVVVSLNGAHLLPACLQALEEQTLPRERFEVVLVDNGSVDGTVELVSDRWPRVVVLGSDTNLGFAGGNNLALRRVTSPFVVLLNNDAVPEPRFLEELLATARRDGTRDVAALTATVLLADRFREDPDGDVVSASGQRYRRDPFGEVELVNSTGNEVSLEGYGQDRGWLMERSTHCPGAEVFGFCGAAALLRTEALRSVGLFDEDLFLYYEDTDLSWRLRLGGWRVEHCPTAVVRHVHAASSREGSAFFRFHDDRNRLLVLTKNASAPRAVHALMRYPLTVASLALRGDDAQRALTPVRLRVLGSYLRHLPRALGRRRRIGRMARVPRRVVERLLTSAPASTGRPYRAPGSMGAK